GQTSRASGRGCPPRPDTTLALTVRSIQLVSIPCRIHTLWTVSTSTHTDRMIKAEGRAAGDSSDPPAGWPEVLSACPDVLPPIQAQVMRAFARPQIHATADS